MKVITIIKRRLSQAAGLLPHDDWLVLGWVLAIKFLLFIFGVRSFRALENSLGPGWLAMWNRWDSIHYLDVAEFGYRSSSTLKAWFYPMFPWFTRAVASITGNYLASAFIVSGIALMIAAILLRRLVQLDHQPDVARGAVWFFLIFPTAYFLHIGYSESLFLAFALGSIFAARRGRWWPAGALGALAWSTRPTGIVLVPTLAVEALHQWITTKRWDWRWLWIGFVPLGFVTYLFLNWKVSGEPFAFLQMRKPLFAMSFAWPWVGIREAIMNLHRPPNQAEMVGAQELFFVALSFVCLVVSWIRLRPLYAVWMTGNWLLFTCVTFIESAPRYAITLFPIFILFALLAKNRLWNGIITVWSVLFLALFASLFVRGWWAF